MLGFLYCKTGFVYDELNNNFSLYSFCLGFGWILHIVVDGCNNLSCKFGHVIHCMINYLLLEAGRNIQNS